MRRAAPWMCLAAAALLPLANQRLGTAYQFLNYTPRIMVFAILALGLNVMIGFTGLFHLGVAALMAIGVYVFAILTTDIYPFQIGFWAAAPAAMVAAGVAGALVGTPTLRLRGDYLAIVTLGFGEIVRDALKNLDRITKGTQSIINLPGPSFGSGALTGQDQVAWFYVFLGAIVVLVALMRNLERSAIGRAWVAIREDELAAQCMGVNTSKAKLLAHGLGGAVCGLAGVLLAAVQSTSGDPGTAYNFNVSITALCILIIGGLGNVYGVLAGAVILMGFDSIVMGKITEFIQRHGGTGTANVLTQPNNWKFLILGLALVLMMRFRREGVLPSERAKVEMEG